MSDFRWLQRSVFSLLFAAVSFYSGDKYQNYRDRAENRRSLIQEASLLSNATLQSNSDYISDLIGLEDKLPIFWYDNTYISQQPRNDSADIIVLYTVNHFFSEYNRQGAGKRWQSIGRYLDRAHRMNKKVVLSLKETNRFLSQEIDPENPTKTANPSNVVIEGAKVDAIAILQDFVRDFGSHPAVVGWYVADEPTFKPEVHAADRDCRLQLNEDYKCQTYKHVQGYTKCLAIRNTIRSLTDLPGSTKPLFVAVKLYEDVYLPFSENESSENTLEQTAAYQLRDCYDVLMAHQYSIYRKSQRSDVEYFLDRAVERYQLTRKRLQAIGKPFMLTTQTHGTFVFRLPSKAEFEFTTFAPLAIMPDMQAFGYYGRHATLKSPAFTKTPETPYIPYKKNGKAWLPEVWDETIEDLDGFRCALKYRVADLNPQVLGKKNPHIQGDPLQYIKGGFYKCPNAPNKLYALVVNTDTAKAQNLFNQNIFPRKQMSLQIQVPDAGDRTRLDSVARVINKEYFLPVKENGKLNLLIEPRGVRLISFEFKKS